MKLGKLPFLSKDIKHSYKTILLGLIPVAIFIILLEIFVHPEMVVHEMSKLVINGHYELTIILYYVVIGLSHILLCGIVIRYFDKRTVRNLSIISRKNLKILRFLACLSIVLLVYLFDSMNINIGLLSHERLYEVLRRSSYFDTLFKSFPKDYSAYTDLEFFYSFSIFPFSLITFALFVMVYGGFAMGRELSTLDKDI